VSILWQAPDTIAFVARGRRHRSEFHADPSDEVMYMIKGEMICTTSRPKARRKWRSSAKARYLLSGRSAALAALLARLVLLVLERKRRSDERTASSGIARMPCRAVPSGPPRRRLPRDPVSRVYEEFYSEESHRTCGKCGHVTPRPAG